MPVGGEAFQEKLVTCRDELTPCRVEQKTLRSVSCRCTLRCARAAKSLPWRKNMMKPAAQRDATAADEQQKLCENTLKHQTEVDVEFHDEEGKAAEFKNKCSTATSSSRYSEGGGRETTCAQSPAERKIAEQSSHEDVTSEESTAFVVEIEHMRYLEPSKESELESSKESDTARVADVKIYRQSSRADKLPSVKPMFGEL